MTYITLTLFFIFSNYLMSSLTEVDITSGNELRTYYRSSNPTQRPDEYVKELVLYFHADLSNSENNELVTNFGASVETNLKYTKVAHLLAKAKISNHNIASGYTWPRERTEHIKTHTYIKDVIMDMQRSYPNLKRIHLVGFSGGGIAADLFLKFQSKLNYEISSDPSQNLRTLKFHSNKIVLPNNTSLDIASLSGVATSRVAIQPSAQNFILNVPHLYINGDSEDIFNSCYRAGSHPNPQKGDIFTVPFKEIFSGVGPNSASNTCIIHKDNGHSLNFILEKLNCGTGNYNNFTLNQVFDIYGSKLYEKYNYFTCGEEYLTHYIVSNSGHNWPGYDSNLVSLYSNSHLPYNDNLDANEIIIDFIKTHSKEITYGFSF